MKLANTATLVTLTLASSLLVACGKGESGSSRPSDPFQGDGSARVVSIPTPGTCLQNPHVALYSSTRFHPNNPHWQTFNQIGFRPYEYWQGTQRAIPGFPVGYSDAGFCGCRVGYQAVCDGQFGMVCMPIVRDFRDMNFALYRWHGNHFNEFAFYNPGPSELFRPSAYTSYRSARYSCYQNFAQTCDVALNNCGWGRCQPIGQGRIGICVR